MNKFICYLLSLMLLATASFAQDAAKTKGSTKKAPAKTEAPAKGTPSTAEAKPAGKMKKDGTPDMRHKANKEAAKPAAGPTKKDGTPDMRYKKNKEAGKKK